MIARSMVVADGGACSRNPFQHVKGGERTPKPQRRKNQSCDIHILMYYIIIKLKLIRMIVFNVII